MVHATAGLHDIVNDSVRDHSMNENMQRSAFRTRLYIDLEFLADPGFPTGPYFVDPCFTR